MLRFLLILAVFALGLTPASAPAQCYDFSDSTMQGWSQGDPLGHGYNGDLNLVLSGGNPGPFLQAVDTVGGGGDLAIEAPPELTGDLSAYQLGWDEWLPDDPNTVLSTQLVLVASDGTAYRSDTTKENPVAVWSPRQVSFDDSTGWNRIGGTGGFADVTADVAGLYINLDVVQAVVTEAGVDNICLMENPTPVRNITWGTLKARYE